MTRMNVVALDTIPEIRPGADVGSEILAAAAREGHRWTNRSLVVVAQKIVSKAEDRFVDLGSIQPSAQAVEFAALHGKDARLVELVLLQARRIVRMERGIVIAETHHGLVCANAGVDVSNVGEGRALLLPQDPDASAERIRGTLESGLGLELAVIVSDSFGRPWREGQVEVAIGVSGLAPLLDYRGRRDRNGRALSASVQAIADEATSTAGLLMRKDSGRPAVVIEGVDWDRDLQTTATALQRPAAQDLFR